MTIFLVPDGKYKKIMSPSLFFVQTSGLHHYIRKPDNFFLATAHLGRFQYRRPWQHDRYPVKHVVGYSRPSLPYAGLQLLKMVVVDLVQEVIDHLKNTMPGDRGATVAWPPVSPDFIPLSPFCETM